MIPGIEQFYQRIADSIQESITEDWSTALIEAVFYSSTISFHGEYVRAIDGVPRSLRPTLDGMGAFKDLRKLFKEDGKPLWGSATFEIESSGRFKMNWGYDDCDKEGNTLWDAEKWSRIEDERQFRLTRLALKDR